ncbi:MAG: T9SS type A sorting domain-containing protein [Bacteroidetes bacterium]|nr:T9SS type A sorting domain-containing protein [Bacteroidota bacterium]
MKKVNPIILTTLFLTNCLLIFGQWSYEGTPLSFQIKEGQGAFQEIAAGTPDFDQVLKEDALADAAGMPPRFAKDIPLALNPGNAGSWLLTESGWGVWRLAIRTEGALATSLFFKNFELPKDSKLFIYSEDRQQILGAYTDLNNRPDKRFATELINGDQCIVELNIPHQDIPVIPFEISEIAYAYRFAGEEDKGLQGSDFCEVNVNCSPEGDAWQNAKRGVVRIQVKVNSSSYWCTGTLLNNVKFDKIPYILTADHCAYQLGGYASEDDLSKWLFYFNYEGADCESSGPAPGSFSLLGSTKMAQGGNRGSTGSDFYLVRLFSDIPPGQNVYFNGWSALGVSQQNGVTVHHPDGDIKKISTYTTMLETSSWAGNGLDSHWKVIWSETLNGWGVTEGGSSGSPLYDGQGRIIGTLTGGLAACEAQGSLGPDKPDYYGKFSYHWESNGTADTAQLKPWLDPENTGILSLPGVSTSNAQSISITDPRVNIYPNPADEYIMIDFTTFAENDIQVELYNILGELILKRHRIANDQQIKLDIEELAPGSYFVKIDNDQLSLTRKVVIR